MSDQSQESQDWPIGELIGFGHYWHTYEDPSDPEKVIKLSAIPEPTASGFTPTEVLINIVHLRFPQNIPQIFDAGVRDDKVRQLRVQRVHFHATYARMVELKNQSSLSESEREELANLRRDHNKWVDTNEASQYLFSHLDAVGIMFDYATMFNTVRNTQDIPVYIDELYLRLPLDQFEGKLRLELNASDGETAKRLIEEYKGMASV